MNRALCFCAALIFCGCAGGDPLDDISTPDGVAGGIVLSGQLVEGSQGSSQKSKTLVKRAAGDPLAGYKLYCVTFTTTPAAATGTADIDGKVTLEIDAAGVPVGCFVLDTGDNAVATIIFSDGTSTGQTVTFTESTDVGGITVDLANGVALAPIDGGISGSLNMPCPLGTWITDVPREDCTGTTARFTISREPDGEYLVSFILGPIWMSDVQDCVETCQSGLAATESSGTWTISFPHDPIACPSRQMVVNMTPNDDCTELSVQSSYGPCVSCDTGECGCEQGAQTCTASFTAVRN